MVHIGENTLENFDLGLSTGRWAFPLSVPSPDVAEIEVGDLVFFGVQGGPRVGGQLAGWQTRTLHEAHVARVTRGPYTNSAPYWLDEIETNTVLYNPTIDIELLSTLGPTPLAPGVALSAAATDALYRGAVSHMARRVPTTGSPVLSGTVGSSATPRRTRASASPRRRSSPAAPPPPGAPRFVAVEKRRSYKAIVKARPETVADPAESRLVHDYTEHLTGGGDEVCRLAIPLPSGTTIQNDIIIKTRKALVEAKGATTRSNVRTAIGQVIDYRRFWKPSICGVLLPSEPDDDLMGLLDSAGIAAVWRTGSGWADSAGGALT
jgi:hypothetical protein